MKLLILMGSPRLHGNTAELCKPFMEELKAQNIEVQYIELERTTINPCKECYACQDVAGEYGCAQKDDMIDIAERILWADTVILATPIFSWYCTAKMKALLDRHYGFNKYYGSAQGCLWEGKNVGIIATHGYDRDYATDLFETGIKRLCIHSNLKYIGMYSVQDDDNLASFQTTEAIEGAKTFARRVISEQDSMIYKPGICDGYTPCPNYHIRLETEADHKEVENLVRESFWNVYRPGCMEHYLIHELRNHPDFVKELDFVMEMDGRIIGQNAFTKAEIIADDGAHIPVLTMGPICIANDLKRQGYGKALLDYSLEKAAELGFGAVCFEGNIGFYGKSGFVVASEKNIHYDGEPLDAVVPYFLLKELKEGYLDGVEGVFYQPMAQYADEEAADEYDKQFPPKEKKKLPGQLTH